MKVTVDPWRLAHLILLMATTWLGGLYLIEEWELSRLSAYGVSCFGACQLSNVILRLFGVDDKRVVLNDDADDAGADRMKKSARNKKHKKRQ
jgi:hypothetical protein